MTVLEHNPVSYLDGLLDHANSLRTLSLTKGNSLELIRHAKSSCEVQKSLEGVSTDGEHVHQRSESRGVLVNVLHAGIDRGYVEVSHLVLHVKLESVQ